MTRLFACLAALSAACASVAKDGGHKDVGRILRERHGVETHWHEGPPERSTIKQLVDERLADGMSAKDAVEIALANSPELQATYEELGISQADMVQAGLLSNPTLSGSIGIPINNRGTLESEFSLVQGLMELFTLGVRKRIAEKQFSLDVSRVAHATLRVVFEARKHFFEAQSLEQLVQLRRTIVESAEAAAALAIKQHAVGNIPDLTFANERATYEQAKVDLARDELALTEAREGLNRLLGLWAGQTSWKTQEHLAELPKAEASVEHLEPLAMRRRLDLDVARKEVELAAKALALARSTRFFGRFEVGVHSHQDPNGPVLLGPSLTLDLPIFDQRQAFIARLEAQQRRAERLLDKAAIDARSEVRVACARLLSLRLLVEHFRDVLLPLRARVVDESQLQYNAMQIGLFQLVDAKQKQIEAYRSYIENLRDYWTARAELEQAVGGGLPSGDGNG